jgi:ethanolamine utilization protein EutJ
MPLKESVNRRIRAFEDTLALSNGKKHTERLFAGIDLGTSYIVTAVVNEEGAPVAGRVTRSRSSIRDGLVLDYVGAIAILGRQVADLRAAGFPIETASAAYPPGTTGRNAQAFGNVVRAAGLELCGLIDEPTAASLVLDIRDGAVVDIGGGTTGISILKDGEVIYTADEPTGGTHIDLVLAGHYGIDKDDAEELKRDPARQKEIFPLICPVFQKMASIVSVHMKGLSPQTIYLVGGTSCFSGIETVVHEETGLTTVKPHNPMLVTPLGIALSCARESIKRDVTRRDE